MRNSMIHITDDMSNFENDYKNVMAFTPTIDPIVVFQSILEYEIGVDLKKLLSSAINPLNISLNNGQLTVNPSLPQPPKDDDYYKPVLQRVLDDIQIVEHREDISRYKSLLMRLMLFRCIVTKIM